MNLLELIEMLLKILQDLQPILKQAGDVKQKLEAEKASLQELAAQRAAAESDLAKAKSEHTKAIHEEADKVSLARNQAAMDLKRLNEQSEVAKRRISELESEIRSKQALHDQVLNSLESLRHKLG